MFDYGNKYADFYSQVKELTPVYQEESYSVDFEESEPVKKVSLEDGFWLTRNHCTSIDLEYWSYITGLTKDEIIEQAKGKLIWLDPLLYEMTEDIYNGWLAKDQYLTGNIVKKYKDTVRINKKTGGLFDANLTLLNENMPDKVDFNDIYISLGATWVPVQFIEMFIERLLEMHYLRVEYNAYLGKWSIQQLDAPNYVLNFHTYGTQRMPAIKIIEKILNGIPVKVYDQVPSVDREGTVSVVNQTETLAVQEKKLSILREWDEFCHSNSYIEESLQEAFANRFGYGLSKYDGSFLKLDDMNPAITLFPYQKDAIAHILMSPSVLLAHDVGAGKTYEYSAGIHELIRMGLGTKAIVVVPNSTLESTYQAYRELYPQDNVFKIDPKKDFNPANRKRTINEMKSDRYAVVFMAYSSFDMLTMKKKYSIEKMKDEIRECLLQIEGARNYATKQRYETRLKSLRKKLEKFREDFEETECSVFNELGFDILVVDEAHNFKNISIDRSDTNIIGFHAKGSKKADNLLEKVEYIQKIDGKVIFATGTPITNSLIDIYVFQRYLQPDEMKTARIFHFNDWLSLFCAEEQGFEVDVDSKNCRLVTRFSKFHNLPELMHIFSDVCDFYQCDREELDLPDFNGYTDIVVKRSDELREYIDELAKRTEKIRSHIVRRREDNLLKVTVDGRLAALDIRLVKPELKYLPVSNRNQERKVRVCAEKVAEFFYKYEQATQIVFCDLSVPQEGFNLYDELKKELIDLGIPEAEVRFIHEATTEAKRARMEKQFNKGEFRILVGSTSKLGTGTNVQNRLIAIHYMTTPWRPADMIQCEGRIIRQGNTNEEVHVCRYITEKSYDAYIYQILENKQKFISDFLSGVLSALHREETDCADIVLSYAEIKALAIGNPLIKTRVEVSNKLEHARIKQRHARKELDALIELSKLLPEKIENKKKLIECTKMDIQHRDVRKESLTMEERVAFGEELLLAIQGNIDRDVDRVFTDFHGFTVILPKHMKWEKPYVVLKGSTGNSYSVKMNTDKAIGCCMKIEHALNHLPDVLKRHRDDLAELEVQRRQAQHDIEQGNAYDEQVQELREELDKLDNELKKISGGLNHDN